MSGGSPGMMKRQEWYISKNTFCMPEIEYLLILNPWSFMGENIMMKYILTTLTIATIMLRCTLSMAALAITPMQDPSALANMLAGEGIHILQDSISYTGDPGAAGAFSDGRVSGLDMNTGVILRTGSPESDNVRRANTLEFNFTSATQKIYCQYAFATEEYDDAGMPIYSDILILYVDGKHVALLLDAVTPVSIRKLVEQNSTDFYDNRDNFFSINYSGFTKALTVAAVNLNPNRVSHHFKLLAMNEDDQNKYSAILLEAGSCRATSGQSPEPDITPTPEPTLPVAIPEPDTLALVVLGLIGGLALARRRRSKKNIPLHKP